MRKKIWMILLTVTLFLSGAFLGVSTVYRTQEVTVCASLVSKAAEQEVNALQAELNEKYDKISMFTVDETLAKQTLSAYPYLRLTGFEKAFPNRIIISVAEDEEMYAVQTANDTQMHYILNQNGIVLGIREDTKNRSDNAENLPIIGLTATGEKGTMLTGDACLETLFSFLNEVSLSLNGIRRNVIKVEVIRRAALEEETVFKLCMSEGVNVYVRNPSAMTKEKAQTAINAYLSLTSEQKLKGMIMLSDVNGVLEYAYTPLDALAK